MIGNKKIRNLILLFGVICFVGVGYFNTIDKYPDYIISALLILGALKTILDFFLGFPIRVGYSGDVLDTVDNQFGRIMLLLLSICMAIFAFWWLFSKTIISF